MKRSTVANKGRLCGAPDLVLRSFGLLGVHPVGDLLRLARRGEDGAFVATQHLKPGGDVARMVGARFDAKVEIGADHRAQQLDRTFLHGIGGRTEPSREIAVKAMLGAGGVATFMEQHGVVGDRVAEAGELRHLHMIGSRAVEGLRPAVANIDIQRRAEAFGSLDPLGIGQSRYRGRRVAIDLGAIEDGVAAGEHAPGRLVTMVVVLDVRLAMAFGDLPEHDKVAAFAFANLGAERLPLAIGAQMPTG